MEKVRIGMIGCGRIFDLHAGGYAQHPDAEIAAVCDVDAAAAEKKQKQWAAEKRYADYRELLDDPDIDAVDILTPQKQHEQMTLDAIDAGKHVMLQKPMTISLESADRMIAAAGKAKTVFKVIENYVFYPPIRYCKEAISGGEIGEPIHMRIKFLSGSSGGWDVPEETWAWRFAENAEGRGMQTFDHGHHMWSTAWYLFGDFQRVFAWIDSYNDVVDCPSTIMWKHAEGMRYGVCDYTHAYEMHIPSKYYANDEWIEVYGSKGIIRVNRCTGNVQQGAPVSLFNGYSWKHEQSIPSDWSEGFAGSTNNFIHAIQGKEDPLLNAEQAKAILSISFAIERSSRERREVYISELSSSLGEQYSREQIQEEIQQRSERRMLTLDELKNGPRML